MVVHLCNTLPRLSREVSIDTDVAYKIVLSYGAKTHRLTVDETAKIQVDR